ncbi:NPCBM/NEW2 domain-containing protein [Pseudobacteroides cellulosolvens]|uniref:Glycosyl hydrolase family 98 putative carbohydrate binding module n=1 Tax=Pseudobacteroides cellulosolvens ATCC 35603 = DSM 2933 TaxID=398512 RepID=A0A0L6JQI7_9FIRM|nr:NPCBM/NEW2 domain-containing protein [Pseudobacteroides cellulosolvens]KNY27955.1 Glycosyl hydrolase family 98 putative carbohydrate binding module [Pseudobacteroides cellulosolvens ATCC 35603 = DSM 2933]
MRKKFVIPLILILCVIINNSFLYALSDKKPAIPVINSPANNTVIDKSKVTIAWNDPYIQKPHYIWLVQEPENIIILKKIEIKKGVNKYTVPSSFLKPGIKYRYKVGALVSKNNIYYSTISYFKTAQPPEITNPESEGKIDIFDAVLKWEPVNPNENYVLRLADDSSGKIILNNISFQNVAEYKLLPENLSYGKKYRYVIGVKDSYKNISWSNVRKFTVNEKKKPPVFISDIVDKTQYQDNTSMVFDMNYNKEPIKICHINYKNSILMKPGTILTVPLNGKYETFSSVIGLEESVYLYGGSVTFKVSGDGRSLFESQVIKNEPSKFFHAMPRKIDIDVKGVKELTLEVRDAGDGSDYDFGIWACPVVYESKPNVKYSTAGYSLGDGEKGITLYSNFPESVYDHHINDQKVCVLFRRNGIIGKNNIIADHLNVSTKQKPLYFGVFLHNKSQKDAFLKVTNKGASSMPVNSSMFMLDALRAYTQSVQTSTTLKAGEYYYLFNHPSLVLSPQGQELNDFVNAIARFETDQILEVTICLVEDPSIFDTPALIDTYPEVPFDGYTRTYRGTAENNPVVNFSLNATINDTDIDSSPIIVTYPVYNAQENKWNPESVNFPGWFTNITSDKIDGAIVSDMFSFKEILNNTNIIISPTNRYPENGPYLSNLGNWGIRYKERIHIKNNTDKTRIIKYYLGNVIANNNYLDVLAYTPSGEPIMGMDPKELSPNKELLKLVQETKVPPFGEKNIDFEYIFPNNSSGGIYHTLLQQEAK